MSLPHITPIREDKWNDHSFNKFSALEVKDSGQDGYDFFINMDNLYLLSEIKSQSSLEPKLLEARYKYALVLIGMSILKEYNDKKEKSNEENTLDKIKDFSRIVSLIILPMIATLGDLDLSKNKV